MTFELVESQLSRKIQLSSHIPSIKMIVLSKFWLWFSQYLEEMLEVVIANPESSHLRDSVAIAIAKESNDLNSSLQDVQDSQKDTMETVSFDIMEEKVSQGPIMESNITTTIMETAQTQAYADLSSQDSLLDFSSLPPVTPPVEQPSSIMVAESPELPVLAFSWEMSVTLASFVISVPLSSVSSNSLMIVADGISLHSCEESIGILRLCAKIEGITAVGIDGIEFLSKTPISVTLSLPKNPLSERYDELIDCIFDVKKLNEISTLEVGVVCPKIEALLSQRNIEFLMQIASGNFANTPKMEASLPQSFLETVFHRRRVFLGLDEIKEGESFLQLKKVTFDCGVIVIKLRPIEEQQPAVTVQLNEILVSLADIGVASSLRLSLHSLAVFDHHSSELFSIPIILEGEDDKAAVEASFAIDKRVYLKKSKVVSVQVLLGIVKLSSNPSLVVSMLGLLSSSEKNQRRTSLEEIESTRESTEETPLTLSFDSSIKCVLLSLHDNTDEVSQISLQEICLSGHVGSETLFISSSLGKFVVKDVLGKVNAIETTEEKTVQCLFDRQSSSDAISCKLKQMSIVIEPNFVSKLKSVVEWLSDCVPSLKNETVSSSSSVVLHEKASQRNVTLDFAVERPHLCLHDASFAGKSIIVEFGSITTKGELSNFVCSINGCSAFAMMGGSQTPHVLIERWNGNAVCGLSNNASKDSSQNNRFTVEASAAMIALRASTLHLGFIHDLGMRFAESLSPSPRINANAITIEKCKEENKNSKQVPPSSAFFKFSVHLFAFELIDQALFSVVDTSFGFESSNCSPRELALTFSLGNAELSGMQVSGESSRSTRLLSLGDCVGSSSENSLAINVAYEKNVDHTKGIRDKKKF